MTALLSSSSEIVAYIVSGLFFEKFGVRCSYLVSLLIAALGGMLILFYGLAHQDSLSFPILFLITKFGVSCAYNILIVGNARLFNVEKAATAFGTTSFLARLIQGASPLVSTIE